MHFFLFRNGITVLKDYWSETRTQSHKTTIIITRDGGMFDLGVLAGHVLADVDQPDAAEWLVAADGRKEPDADERVQRLVQRQCWRATRTVQSGAGFGTAEHHARLFRRPNRVLVYGQHPGHLVPAQVQCVPVPLNRYIRRVDYLSNSRAHRWSSSLALDQSHAHRFPVFFTDVPAVERSRARRGSIAPQRPEKRSFHHRKTRRFRRISIMDKEHENVLV